MKDDVQVTVDVVTQRTRYENTGVISQRRRQQRRLSPSSLLARRGAAAQQCISRRAHRQDKRTTKPNWTILLRDHRPLCPNCTAETALRPRRDSCMSTASRSVFDRHRHCIASSSSSSSGPSSIVNVICLKLLPICYELSQEPSHT